MVVRPIGKEAGVEMNVKEQEKKKKIMDIGNMEQLVTIEKFLENGGILNKGREIFSMDANCVKPWPVGTYKEYDDSLKAHFISNRTFKSMSISKYNKVMINVKPIWK